MRRYTKNFFSLVFIITSIMVFGQEYDDLYFTKKDRQKLKKGTKYFENLNEVTPREGLHEKNVQTSASTSFLGKQSSYKLLSGSDDPKVAISKASLDRYKAPKTKDDYRVDRIYDDKDQPSPNPRYNDDPQGFQDQKVIVNNYYGNNWRRRNLWNRPGWRFGLGWNNWGGNYWGGSYGGNWFGNTWYDPFWDSGYNNPYWCAPYWGGYTTQYYSRNAYTRPVVISDRRSSGREVVRGARNARGGAIVSSGRQSVNLRNNAIEQPNDARDFSRQQKAYLNKSRRTKTSAPGGSLANDYPHNAGNRNSSSYNRRSRSVTISPPSRTNRSRNVNTNPSRSSGRSGSYRSGGSPPKSSSGRSTRSSSGRSSSRRDN